MFIIYKLNDKLYYNNIEGDLITDPVIIKYVKSLVIPPAYTNVKIYYYTDDEIPKILYEGFDSKNRKQVIYSKEWCAAKENEKFKNLIEFSKMIPSITKAIDKFLLSQKLSKNKTISIILKLIIECGFRIGNKKYLQLYDSYGISNIKKKHIEINDSLNINFKGKKGIQNTCSISDKLLIENIKHIIKDKEPEEHLFILKDTVIKDKTINNFLKQFDKSFSSKMFRTYYANINFINSLNKSTNTNLKKNVINALNIVSNSINNTANISKKNYIHNGILKLYLENNNKYKKMFDNNRHTRTNFINFLQHLK